MKNKNPNKSDRKILFFIAIISTIAFTFVFQSVVNGEKLNYLDRQTNSFINEIQYPLIIIISKIISAVFEPVIFGVLFILSVITLIYQKRKREAIVLAWLTIFSFAVLSAIKLFVGRERPLNSLVLESSFSFPSGHAFMAVVFFGALIYLYENHIKNDLKKKILTFSAVLAVIIISFSRVYLNVHWASDIIASFALGIFFLSSFALLIQKTRIIKKNLISPVVISCS